MWRYRHRQTQQCRHSNGGGCRGRGSKGQEGGALGAPLGIFPMGLISGLAVSGFSYLQE